MDFKYGGETPPVPVKKLHHWPVEKLHQWPVEKLHQWPVEKLHHWPVEKLCQLLVNTLIRYNKIEMGLKNVWLDGIKK